MEGHFCQTGKTERTLSIDSRHVVTSRRSYEECGQDKDGHISSVAVDGDGHGRDAEMPARG